MEVLRLRVLLELNFGGRRLCRSNIMRQILILIFIGHVWLPRNLERVYDKDRTQRLTEP